LERVAGDQGRNVRRAAQAVLGWIAGPPGRALAYKYFSGEYVFENTRWGGALDVASLGKDDLSGAWSPPRRKPGELPFRWAMEPASCVRVPLEAPMELAVSVTARAPGGAQPQQLTVLWNEHPVGTAPVGIEWGDARFTLPLDAGVAGENWLCLRFAKTLPNDREDRSLCAEVGRIHFH
jgi:hypothetical protein